MNTRTIIIASLLLAFAAAPLSIRGQSSIVLYAGQPGVQVFLDNRLVGTTASDGKIFIDAVPGGRHRIRLEKTGFLPIVEAIEVDAVVSSSLSYTLSAVPSAPKEPFFPGATTREQLSNLFITCNVEGARVAIDGQARGTTTAGGTLILTLASGSHELSVEKAGYSRYTKSLFVSPELDSRERVVLSEIEADESSVPLIALVGLILIGVGFILWKIFLESRTLGMFGHFKLLKAIGKGGIATIYRAKDLDTKRTVALKVMDFGLVRDQDLVYKFFSEGEAISRINKEYPQAPVVKVHEYGRDKAKSLGIPFVSMEFVKGSNLLQLVKQDGKLTLKRKFEILKEVARGLYFAHALNIYHGDITPDNVIIDGEKVTLIDFGIAVQAHDSYKNMDSSVAGKPVYMSPEQCRGEPITSKSDIYSLGIIIFFLLAGAPPFVAKNPLEILRMHQDSPLPPLPPHVSEEVRTFVFSMLDKDPGKRPDAATVEAALGLFAAKL